MSNSIRWCKGLEAFQLTAVLFAAIHTGGYAQKQITNPKLLWYGN
jgi:hypothetical protein